MSAVKDFDECEELYNTIRSKALEHQEHGVLGSATASFDLRNLPRLRKLNSDLDLGISLYELQSHCNSGRGVSAARQVAQELMRGEMEGAKAIAAVDWDKIRNYPALVKWLQEKNIAGLDW